MVSFVWYNQITSADTPIVRLLDKNIATLRMYIKTTRMICEQLIQESDWTQ